MAAPCAIGKKVKSRGAGDAVLPKNVQPLEDFMCPVCLDILIEPVTMPCSHVLCLRCFRQNVQHSSLCCPICRARISSWTRRMNRQNCLVNRSLWTSIQKTFPDKVQRSLQGLCKQTDEGIVSDAESDEGIVPVHQPLICEPGEIRKEYEELLTKAKEEENRLREIEEKKSEQLIRQLQEEEQIEKQKRLSEIQKDYSLAKRLGATIVEVPATVTGLILRSASVNDNVILAAPSLTRRSQSCIPLSATTKTKDSPPPSKRHAKKFVLYKKLPQDASESQSGSRDCGSQTIPGSSSSSGKESTARSNSIESEDSITEELRHFRPIKVAPKTPPRLLPNGLVDDEPQVIHATPRILTLQSDSEADCSSSSSAAWLQRRLALVESDRRNKMAAYSQSIERKEPVARTGIEIEEQQQQKLQSLPGPVPVAALITMQSVNSEHADTVKRKSGEDQNNNHPAKRTSSVSTETNLKPDRSHFLENRHDEVDLHRFTTDFEESDRLLAFELHRQLRKEWSRNPYAIDRRKGTPDEYNLRRK